MSPDCKSGRESVRWFESISAHHRRELIDFQFIGYFLYFCINLLKEYFTFDILKKILLQKKEGCLWKKRKLDYGKLF